MPCLSGNITHHHQIIIDAELRKLGATNMQPFRALIDTGANCSCISKDVIDALGLMPIGKVPMRSASHLIEADQYIVDLGVVLTGHTLEHSGMIVIECAQIDEYEVILGMDVIMAGSLQVTFDGRFVFCL